MSSAPSKSSTGFTSGFAPSTKNNEEKFYKQLISNSTKGYFFFLMLLIVVLFIGIFSKHSDESFNKGSFQALNDDINITFEDGSSKYVTLPCDIKVPHGQGLTAEVFLPRQVKNHDQLFIYSDEQDIKAYIANELRGEYRGSTYSHHVSIPSGWFTIDLSSKDSARPLKLEINADSSYYTKGVIHSIYIGDRAAIIYHIFWTQAFWGILGFFIFLLGMILAVFFFIYRKDSFIKRYIYIWASA
jgi:hypothetical protein